MLDGVEFGKEVVDLVRGYVEREFAPIKAENESLKARIAALEARPGAEKGDAGENGADGVSPTPDAIAEAFGERLKAMVDEAVAAIPPAESGPPGEKGDDGERGADGNDGQAGLDGRDGRGVKDLLIDREGQLIATMDDGTMKSLGVVCGKDGNDGAAGVNGKDGFSLDAFNIDKGDDGRTYVLKFEGEDVVHKYEMTFPVPVYCGVFKEGNEYVPGDLATWGGSLWHCDTVTKDKPSAENWTLAVRRGRDGKDAKVG